MNEQVPMYAGVDDGHYSIKVFTESGKMVCIPSRAAMGRHLISWQGGDDENAGFYNTDEGMSYTVNEYLQKYEDTRFKDYPKSTLNRVLVHHALNKAGLGGKQVVIATGLPVSYYYFADGQKNETLITAKVDSLGKQVTSGTVPMSSIIRNFVATEAIAAYFDQLMDIEGNPTAEYEMFKNSTVGVIDIGGKTTDCAIIYPGGSHVDASRSGSSDTGVLQLNDAVEARLRAKYDLDNVPPKMIEMAITSNEVKVAGEIHNVEDIVLYEKERLAEQIMIGVRTKIGSGKDLDIVLFVGGGAIVMRDQLSKHYPHSRFPEQPEFANARGMYKIAKYVFAGA